MTEVVQAILALVLALCVMTAAPLVAIAVLASRKGRQAVARSSLRIGRAALVVFAALALFSLVQVMIYSGPDVRFAWQR